MNCHKNSSIGSQTVPCGWADTIKLRVTFRNFGTHQKLLNPYFFSWAANYFEICTSKKCANICPEINIAWDQKGRLSKIL